VLHSSNINWKTGNNHQWDVITLNMQCEEKACEQLE